MVTWALIETRRGQIVLEILRMTEVAESDRRLVVETMD